VLAKTSTPHATYLASGPLKRRLLNQTSFKRLLIGEDSEVLGTTLTPVYAALSDWEPKLGQPRPKKSTKARGAETKTPALLPWAGVYTSNLNGDGGNRTHVRDRV
jgi:hypothetical protein